MDNLIEEVIQRLKKRQNSEITVSVNQLETPDEQIFVDHGKVILTDIPIELIVDLYSMKRGNPWVAWLLKGISYNVHFFLNINEQLVNFVPRTMVLDWPLIFVVEGKRPLIASHNQAITREEIAGLPDKSILVQYHKQHLTAEAQDICRYKDIKIKIRTEENCIWQKL